MHMIPAPGIPPLLPFLPVLRKLKLLRSRTRSRVTRSSIATATSKTRTIPTPSSTSSRNSATRAPSLTRSPDATRSMPVSSQLLEIGTVGAPQMGGKYYFHTRREGNQNQPDPLCARGVERRRPCAGRRQQTRATGPSPSTGGMRRKMANTSPMGRRRAAPRSAPYA